MNYVDEKTFPAVFYNLKYRLQRAPRVKTERWQGVEANTETREITNVCFEVDLCGDESLDRWREEIKPNLPWADDHFLERVGGHPLNPGEQWKHWPWGQSARKFKTDIFNHTYMERFWPKYARRTTGGILPDKLAGSLRAYPEKDRRPKFGTAFSYGDLEDFVELLAGEPHTRQAWMPLFHPEDTGKSDGGRKMCSLGYQVLVRDSRASIWYPLRSVDFVRHMRDDCYLAVRMLLWIIDRCRERSDFWKTIRPGTYAMHCTSLHIFKDDKL